MKLAQLIKQARKEEGLTQEQLGEKIGMFKGNISRIESGKQSITTDTLIKIANALSRDLSLNKKPIQ